LAWYQGNDLKKPSGGLKERHRGKRKHELGRPPTYTTLASEDERKHVRVRGGGYKIRLSKAAYVNTAMPEEKIVKKLRILEVVETPSNTQYARSNILTRGAIVKTELGLVRITSRPGQDGVLNGVLIKKIS